MQIETREVDGKTWYSAPDIARYLGITKRNKRRYIEKIPRGAEEGCVHNFHRNPKWSLHPCNCVMYLSKKGYRYFIDCLKKLTVADKTDVADVLEHLKRVKVILDTKQKKKPNGYIYLLHNLTGTIAKVGKATDCRKRWRSYQCPHNWVPKVAIAVPNQIKAENKLIKYMHSQYTLSNGREFFWCDNLTPVIKYMEGFGENIISQI